MTIEENPKVTKIRKLINKFNLNKPRTKDDSVQISTMKELDFFEYKKIAKEFNMPKNIKISNPNNSIAPFSIPRFCAAISTLFVLTILFNIVSLGR